jgi:thiol:disulfide interchange protein DsbD
MDLAENYHAYLDRFKFVIESPEGLKLDRQRVSPIVPFMDVVSKKMKDGVKGHAEMRLTFEVPESFKQTQYNVEVRLTYQACTEDHCLFPKTIPLKTSFTVTPAMASGQAGEAPQARPTAPPSEFENALGRGTIAALVFVFAVGFLTSLTPCVYPMIPITLAVLGARSHQHGHNKIRSLALSIVYVLGIALTYSALGVTAATTGSLFGSALSNIWVVGALAVLFVAMGLSMYGLFEIQAPAFIRDRVGLAKTNSGYLGAFVTGIIAGVVASPCVGPVLVSVLAYIAKTQDRFLGFILLFTFALGMGVLFIVLGVSGTLLQRLPRAGGWMDGVKFIFGTTMIGMALNYIAPLTPMWIFRILLGLTVVLITSFFGAFAPNPTLSPLGRIKKGLMFAAFLIGVVFAAIGILERAGVSLFRPAPALAGSGSVNGEGGDFAEPFPKLAWQPFSDMALKNALKKKEPVIIDFYADWCAACKELERYTFIDPRIRGLSDQFTLLKVDATEDSPALEKLKNTYQVLGLPTMIFYDTKGGLRSDLTLTGFEEADKFLARMNQALGR